MAVNVGELFVKISTDTKELTKGLEKASKEIEKFKNNTIKAGKAGEQVGKELGEGVEKGFTQKIKKLPSVFQNTLNKMEKIGKAATTKITLPLVGAATAITVGTKEFRKELSMLDTNAQRAGASISEVRDILKNLNVLTGETDSNVEALSNLLQAGFTGTSLKQVIEDLSGAVIAFPDTLKIEGLSDGLQETLATGEAVGPFGELLERLGINLEYFNLGLADAIEKGQQHNYVLGILAESGLAKTTEAWRENNAEMIKAEEAQERIRFAMADLAATLEPVITRVTEVIAGLIEKFNQLNPATQNNIIQILMLAAAFGPLVSIVGYLGTTFIKVIDGVKKFAAILGVPVGPIMLLIGTLGLFIGALIKTEDESITRAQSIGDHFAALGQRVLGVLQFIAGIIQSIIAVAVSGIVILMENALGKVKSFVSGIQNLANKLGLDWLSEKIGSGVSSIDGAINKLKDTRQSVTGAALDTLEEALYRMDRPMDVVIANRVKKGKLGLPEGFVGEVWDGKFLSDEALKAIEKDRAMKTKLELKIPEVKTTEIQTPEIPDLERLLKKQEELEKKSKKTNKQAKEAIKNSNAIIKAVDKVIEAMKKLGEEFTNTSDNIRGYIGIFDKFRSKTISPYRLLRNAQERAKAYLERERLLLALEGRGIPAYIMEELHKSGMDALGALRGLSYMSEEQLGQWIQYQDIGRASADRQAMNQVIIEHISIDARDRSIEEVERELYGRLRARGVSIW
ncbi:phage tail tape measure protein [Tepidimicrobium xylanilyticum]